MVAVRVDSKGRLTIPKETRERLNIRPGDTFFVQEDGEVLRYAKAHDPFDVLAEEALEEYRHGETENLRDLAGRREPREK
jgi:antitoxin PrlF